MSSRYFGLVEALFILGLVIAFYVWQMRTLNRDIKAREEREAKERSTPPATAGHAEREHEFDES